MYRPRDGRNTKPLTEAEIGQIFDRIVTNRDKSTMSEKAALGYFKNEIIFRGASRELWLKDPESGCLGAILNDLNTVKAISEIGDSVRANKR